MPAAGLAQPLALSTPLTNAQLPFPLFVNGNEVSQGGSATDLFSYRLRDPGFSGTQTFDFTIVDNTGAVAGWIAKQQPVLWYDSAKAVYLFAGYVKNIGYRTMATYLHIDVTASHISEALDFATPLTVWDAGTHGTSDQAMIGALVGNFSQEQSLGSGGYIQVLNSTTMPASIPTDRTTLRNAIDAVLAATGITGAVAYVDNLGYLHTMAIGDINAPYNISDAPNGTTTIAGTLDVTDQGASDVDALYVYGATAAGSGVVLSSRTPRSPLRWAIINAPNATTAVARNQEALVEFNRRQVALAVKITVTGYDGWAKGQYVTVTNAALGWSAKPLTISAVDMSVLSGTGIRQYQLTAGSDPVLFTGRLRYAYAQWQHLSGMGAKLTGRLGGTLP